MKGIVQWFGFKFILIGFHLNFKLMGYELLQFDFKLNLSYFVMNLWLMRCAMLVHYTCTREKFCYENCFGILSKIFSQGTPYDMKKWERISCFLREKSDKMWFFELFGGFHVNLDLNSISFQFWFQFDFQVIRLCFGNIWLENWV